MSTEVQAPTKEQIEKRAYELYLARSGEPGKDLEDRLAAEIELKIEMEEQHEKTSKIPETKWTASAAASQPGA